MTTPTLTNVPRPRAAGFGAALNDRLFRLAVGPGRELSIQSAPIEAPRVNTSSSAEELTEEFGLVFARSQFDGGAGLFRAHVPNASPSRYWDSKGVSVAPAEPGSFPEVTLLHDVDRIRGSAFTTQRLAVVAGSLYLTDGLTLARSDDPTAETPTFVADNPHAGQTVTDVRSVAGLGDEVYAALGTSGIHRKAAGAWAHWSNVVAERVWSVKSRIVSSNGRSLHEVVAEGDAPDPLKTLATGNSWTSVCDGGSHVLAAADDGYVYGFREVEGVLTLTGQTLFEGEQPQAVGQAQGVIAVVTRQPVAAGAIGRLWVGSLAESGELVDLQLVRQWGDRNSTVDLAAHHILADRESLVIGVPEGGETHLWRYDLSTAGLSRYLVLGATGAVRGLVSIGGRVVATVSGSGLWREATRYVEEGYLIGPLGDFSSASTKSWIGARLETGHLEGTSAELFYTTDPEVLTQPDSSSWRKVIARTTPSSDEVALAGVSSRQLAGMVRLGANIDRDATPAVRSFSFRAYASSGDEDVIVTLPVNVSDQIERAGRRRVRMKGLGDQTYAALREVEGRPVLLTLFQPREVIRGLVESVGVPVVVQSRRGSPTMYASVRIRGRRGSASGSVVEGTFGAYAWGEFPFGGSSLHVG